MMVKRAYMAVQTSGVAATCSAHDFATTGREELNLGRRI